MKPEDRLQYRNIYKKLLQTFSHSSERELLSKYKKMSEQFAQKGCYLEQRYSYDSALFSLQTAEIMVCELNLGIVSLSALFFFYPIYQKIITLDDVKREAPEGTVDLLERLMKAAQLLVRANTLSGEELQQFLLSVAEDARVILILIADRLNALRLAKQFPQETQIQLAEEAFQVFVPLSHKLGLYKAKGEMEDLYLKYSNPTAFYQIKQWLGETKRDREAYMTRFLDPLNKYLKEKSVQWDYSIKFRTKSIFSIHNKMVKKGVAFRDIYDLSAIRIIIDAPREEEHKACWFFYSIVTDLYTPDTKRLRDWITNPKSNGYESLQITVLGPENKYVEVQIRTYRMDSVAERGVAAHWRYKGIVSQSDLDLSLTSVREILEQKQSTTSLPLSEESQIKVDSRSIFAFTPNGDLIRLDKGATLLDFAFAIHSHIGCHAVSGQINNRNAKLRDKLHNGDTVSIQTSRNQKPSIDWLSFVTTSKAKNKIRQEIHRQQESGLEVAKELLQRRFKNRKLVYDEGIFMQLLRKMGYKGNMEFFIDLSEERIQVSQFLDRYQELWSNSLKQEEENKPIETPNTQKVKDLSELKGSNIVIVSSELNEVEYSLGQCCNPKPGDLIYAYPSKKGLRIHSISCPNSIDILGRHGDRVLPAKWKLANEDTSTTTYTFSVEAVERPELCAHIESLCTQTKGIDPLFSNTSTNSGIWTGIFRVSTDQKNVIYTILAKINSLKGVIQAKIDLSE